MPGVWIGPAGRDFTVPYPTAFQRWQVGARFRFRADDALEAWRFGASAGYEHWSFDFDIEDQPGHEMPRARYKFMRAGFDASKPFGRFAALGSVTYLHPVAIEPLGNRTPTGAMTGAELMLGVAVRIVRRVHARISGTYSLFWFHLEPLPGRTDKKGSVVDHYVDTQLGVEVAF